MKFRWRYPLIAFGLIVLIVMIVDFNRRMAEFDRLSSQLDTVRTEGTAVMQTQEALVTEVAYASSTQAVEDWAYEDGRWVRDDEKPIGLLPAAGATPTPTPLPTQTTQDMPNWRIWWELFFGSSNH
jgi:hypothetical protein